MRSIVCLLGIVAFGSAAASGPRSLAVVPLDAPRELTFTGKRLAEAIADEARRGGAFEVMGPEGVEARLGPGGSAAIVRCADDARCLAEHAARLGVERVIAGWLQPSGERYAVTVTHVDVARGVSLASFRREVPIASGRLQADVRALAGGLLVGSADRGGTLRVDASAPGAEVVLDGAPAGTTPLTRAVAAGRHEVRVSKPGFVEAAPVWIDVPPGGEAAHVQRLHAIPAREGGAARPASIP